MSTANKNPLLMLETGDASISTATITIRALQVGKKQMTQSVFRQLPEASLVDEEAVELLGLPWGWVNYHAGSHDFGYTNFVFQVGTRLRRCGFRVRPSGDFSGEGLGPVPIAFDAMASRWHGAVAAFHYARILDGWQPPGDRENSGPSAWGASFASRAFGETIVDELPGHVGRLRRGALDEMMSYAIRQHERLVEGQLSASERWYKKTTDDVASETRERYAAEVESARDWLSRRIVEKIGVSASVGEIAARIRQAEDSAQDYCRRWDGLMDRLRGVEQLFIAV